MQTRNPKTFLRNTMRTLIDAASDGSTKRTSVSGGLIIAVTRRAAGPNTYYVVELSRHAPQVISQVELRTFMRHMPEEYALLTEPKTTEHGYTLTYARNHFSRLH